MHNDFNPFGTIKVPGNLKNCLMAERNSPYYLAAAAVGLGRPEAT